MSGFQTLTVFIQRVIDSFYYVYLVRQVLLGPSVFQFSSKIPEWTLQLTGRHLELDCSGFGSSFWVFGVEQTLLRSHFLHSLHYQISKKSQKKYLKI